MQISTGVNYAGDIVKAADTVAQLEAAGIDAVWIAEAYSFDAVSLMGYLAAKTNTVKIGSGILNIYSRTPSFVLAGIWLGRAAYKLFRDPGEEHLAEEIGRASCRERV